MQKIKSIAKNIAFSQEKLSGGGVASPQVRANVKWMLDEHIHDMLYAFNDIHASNVASERSCTMYALIATYVVILCSNVFMPYCFCDFLVGLILEHVPSMYYVRLCLVDKLSSHCS